MLLDADRPEYLGGQFLHAAIGSLDFASLPDVFRSGQPLAGRPDRYRVAIERLTVQDVAVFFQEVLAALPQLVVDLQDGAVVVDVHCGGGRWLIAMAKRFPGTRLVGVEFEPDSVERARAHVEEAGLADRITIEAGRPRPRRACRRGDARLLPVRAPPARRPAGALRVCLGGRAPGRLARGARLVPARPTRTSCGRATPS